ncbi:MAG TPA: hypothetical protein VHJ82_05845, partial [Actinomycetota bacterium]|nr:hypothetical protein [Actinomycetota bacterium]
ASEDSASQRAAAIYSAAIREIVLQGNSFKEGRNPFDILYILDQADSAAAATGRRQGEREPIPEEVQEGIKEALEELGPIEFVSDSDSVIGSPRKGSQVKNNGALITLGTIPAHKNRIKLGMNMYIANLAAVWLTYIIKRKQDRWVVTGTTGPTAIS